MKKLLIFAMAIIFASCGGDDNTTPTPTPIPTPPTPEKKIKLTKIITTIRYKVENGEKEQKRTLKLFYGTNGFISKSILEGNDDNQNVFTYNDKNQLIKSTETYENEGKEVTDITTYIYNDKGLLITVLEDTGSKNQIETIYEYNDKNLMVKRIRKSNKQVTEDTYEYDTNGQLKKRRYGSGEDETVIVFTFDKKKNPFSLLLPKEFRLTDPLNWGNHNYLIRMTIDNESSKDKDTATYTYNEDDFPTKVVMKEYDIHGKWSGYTETTEYFYE
ncbi:MAG: hypothetical protein KGV44_08060 [Flavobacteriaceae bacterium]|nr:hypothetical protein [Flavobacteriaceae bacterium]